VRCRRRRRRWCRTDRHRRHVLGERDEHEKASDSERDSCRLKPLATLEEKLTPNKNEGNQAHAANEEGADATGDLTSDRHESDPDDRPSPQRPSAQIREAAAR
jgi:hypothetical protein